MPTMIESKSIAWARLVRGLKYALLPALVFGAALWGGQNPPPNPPDLPLGKKVFAENCIGCHGADAKGTDQGPALAGDRRLRGRAGNRIRNIVKNGIPSSGMPAFNLS